MTNWTPKKIKTLRKKYRLSQPALGNLLGVTGNYIYLLEKGVKTPSETLRLLLDCVEKQLKEKGGEK
jgi:DNA-binding transcriptional regulator YiaG